MANDICGLIPAVHTPMRDNGDLNLDIVPDVADMLIGDGVGGMFVCGTTGEFPSLTADERKATAAAYIAAVAGRVPVVVHVGHTCLRVSRELAAHAASLGATAVAAAPPSFIKPADCAGVLDCLRHIADAVPDLPIYYYHIPALTAVDISVCTLLAMARERLPQLAGVKFTFESLMDYRSCLELDNGRYNCLFGRDEMLLGALAIGARGAVGSTYAFAAPLYQKLIEAFDRGDLETARFWQDRSIEMITTLHSRGGLAAFKSASRLRGLDLGPTRLPVPPLSEARHNDVETALHDIGFPGEFGMS